MDSHLNEASEAGASVIASGEASAACVAKKRGSASDARVPGASSDGRWDPRPIQANQTFDIQGSIDAILCCPKCSELGSNTSCLGSKQLSY